MLSLLHVSPLRKAGASLKIGTSGAGFRTTSRRIAVVTVMVGAAWLKGNKEKEKNEKRNRKDRRPWSGDGVLPIPKAILSPFYVDGGKMKAVKQPKEVKELEPFLLLFASWLRDFLEGG